MSDPHDKDGAPAPPADESRGATPASDDPATFLNLLGWPPPGLARIQGDLGMAVRKVLTAAPVLVFPLMLVITVDQPQPGLGPLGASWWIILVTTAFGLMLLLDAMVSLWRVLRRTLRAMGEGYSLFLVGQVLADTARDGGFLMQGAQAYSTMPADQRRMLGHVRVWRHLVLLVAGLWIAAGFGLLLLLGARGIVTPGETAFWTLGPAVLLLLVGMVLRAFDGSLVRRARRAWFRQPWAIELARTEADEWRDAALRRGVPVGGGSSGGAALRVGMVAVLAAGVIAALPPVTLVPASSVGAILGLVSLPGEITLAHAAEAEAYRAYRLDPTSSLTPAEAGELMHGLSFVGVTRDPSAGMRAPAERIEEPWYLEAPVAEWNVLQPAFWGGRLWEMIEEGPPPELRPYLRRVAAHPGHRLMTELARAPAVDLMGARYEVPFPESWRSWNVPIPRSSAYHEAALVHMGVAVLHALEGRRDEAVLTAREVISVGFLLMEESPMLLDHWAGQRMVAIGGEGLGRILRLMGDQAEAEELAARVTTAEAAAETMALGSPAMWMSPDAFWQGRQATASAERAPRALRWSSLMMVSDISPCMNLQRVVYGPGPEYGEWIETMRAELVRYPAEQAYFDLILRGFARMVRPNLVTRVLGLAMGGADQRGSCAQVLGGISEM